MTEIIEEASEKLGDIYESAFLIDGKSAKTPLDMPIQSRILIISKDEHFNPLSGLENFSGATFARATRLGGATYVSGQAPEIKVKPQPETWVQMAQLKWAKSNVTDGM